MYPQQSHLGPAQQLPAGEEARLQSIPRSLTWVNKLFLEICQKALHPLTSALVIPETWTPQISSLQSLAVLDSLPWMSRLCTHLYISKNK